MKSAADRIRDNGIIAILRGDFPLATLPLIAAALADGGIGVIEITLNSSNALKAIDVMRSALGDRLLIGAGTVRTVRDVNLAISAGAQFLVSPNFDPASVDRSLAAGVLHLPGVFTPSEVQAALAAGCRIVKLFPADVGGPAYVKALLAPLDDIEIIAVGGIDESNLADYVGAGAVGVGMGSSLLKGADDDPSAIAIRAAKLTSAFEMAKKNTPTR